MISVVVPAFDAAAYLGDALESVLQQDYSPLEVIVVDDGSSDGSGEIARAFGGPVRVLTQQNSGVSAARNAGIGEARGEYVALLDADDIWLPGKLRRQVEVMRAEPELAFTYGSIEVVDDGGRRTGETVEAPAAEEARCRTLSLRPGGFHLAMTGLIRRGALARCGGFDTALSTSADADMALRLLAFGGAEPVPDAAIACYRQHQKQMHRDASVLERDWRRVLDRALPARGAARRRAEAELSWVLAGSCLETGQRAAAGRHLTGALLRSPRVVATRIAERNER